MVLMIGFGFMSFHKSFRFLLRVFGTLSVISASTRSIADDPAASVSAASPAACFFLRRPVVHYSRSCRLLRAYIVHVVIATQELVVQRYLLPVL